MPLKLVPPRVGKTPYYYVRGTYLGKYVDKSTGTPEKRVASQVLGKIKAAIEAGEFAGKREATFLSAAVAYMEAGREARFVGPLLDHFKERALSSIDQQAIDEAALMLYPDATAATRNRQVYTTVSAILKHAGQDNKLKRPKGWRGTQRTEWLWPEQAFALFQAADKIDAEFGVFLRVLCYTGMRLSEALNLRWEDVRLDEGFAYLPQTKGGDPRAVFLTLLIRDLLGRLHETTARHPKNRHTARVFRYSKSGRLYQLLRLSQLAAGGHKVGFHVLRHTWATWMRRYGGLDTRGLVGTGAWRDRASASRYEHVVPSEEAMRAAMLPVEGQSTDTPPKAVPGSANVRRVMSGKVAENGGRDRD